MHTRRVVAGLWLGTALFANAMAAEPQKQAPDTKKEQAGIAYTDPAVAAAQDPDFLVQGEYAGSLLVGESRRKTGVQVIALGDHRFRAVFYPGGLPGDGWEKAKGKTRMEGHTQQDGITLFPGKPWTAGIRAGVMSLSDPGGTEMGALTRVERMSPTLAAKPPPDALVLFDGTSAANFKPGSLTDDGLLKANATSVRAFRDFAVHLEFRAPYKPFARGQARGNSGVYLQKRYEVQVLDSFGLEGKDNECGGIYKTAAPLVNMCFPPLAWQTYDIVFSAARFDEAGNKTAKARATVRHNGVLIHDQVEIAGPTGGGWKEDPKPGPLYLQGHGNPVVFRNIWVVEKK
ncbi:MAG: DUF1080 domain-containing protein [Kiritimatiellae bacterium]|nr:DUF1080 domain-containing protein [Kiritimatiellia bacterium]